MASDASYEKQALADPLKSATSSGALLANGASRRRPRSLLCRPEALASIDELASMWGVSSNTARRRLLALDKLSRVAVAFVRGRLVVEIGRRLFADREALERIVSSLPTEPGHRLQEIADERERLTARSRALAAEARLIRLLAR